MPSPALQLLETTAANYRLGRITTDAILDAADHCLSLGLCSDALIQLSLTTPLDIDRGRPAQLLAQACRELGIPPHADRRSAALHLIAQSLHRALNGSIPPHDAVAEIMSIHRFADLPDGPTVGDALGAEMLIGLYWSYDEAMEMDLHGTINEHTRTQLDRDVIIAARKWLAAHPH